jgi:hypothetical protein
MGLKISAYNKVFDFIRVDLLCQTFPEIIYDEKKLGISVAFGGASVVFIREIPILRKYNIHARVIGWSPKGKWLYIQGVFTLPLSQKSTPSKETSQLPSLLDKFDADPGTSTPANMIHKPTATINGETICAVIYGRYVFKRRNRETVPIPELLEICGYAGDEEIEKKRAEGWNYVEKMEHDWDKDRALQSARDI